MENITYENTNYFNFNGLIVKAKVLRIYDGYLKSFIII